MGFYSLANTYYEIYKFNQNEKDAGTYRIEYMLAKAERKPYKELYGILISANEKETSDIWDFEMLLLYKAMGNEENSSRKPRCSVQLIKVHLILTR